MKNRRDTGLIGHARRVLVIGVPAVGLALAGDEAVFLELLGRFVTAHQDGVPGLDSSLATGQFELARRMVHSLKGSAAAIGAETLRRQAAVCESAIERRGRAIRE